MNRRTIGLMVIGLLLVLAGFAGGVAARGLWARVRPEGHPLLSEAETLLQAHYLHELPPSVSLERGMIRGMLEVVGDPFTVYLDPAAHELMTDTLTGEYGGIGVVLTRDSDGRLRLMPMAGGPAELAGVLEGDVLLAIDDVTVLSDWAMDEVGAALRGPQGSVVQLLLAGRSSGERERRVTIRRRIIPLPSATGFLLPERPDIGVLALSAFTEHTPQEVQAAYSELAARGMQALVLDLRANPGGLVESGVAVAEFFLESGTVVIEQRRGEREVVHTAEDPGPGGTLPLAVLVDHATASAAEIVAAALQANGRAPLIGETTFGKGSVQLIFELADGSSLHVTSARWLTPDHRALDGIGLTPDVAVQRAAPAPGDPFMAAAIRWLDGLTGVAP